MNYVFDVTLNFKYPLYDFYEWDLDDFIINFKKVPLYKIKSKDLFNLKYSKFKLDYIKLPLSKAYNHHKKYLAVIFTDGKTSAAFHMDGNGNVIGKSSILPEEEEEILDSSNYLKDTKINYKILSKDKISYEKTRNEIKISKYLVDEINKINDINKLEYISFECLGKNMSKKELINVIKEKWNDEYFKIYDFFRSNSLNNN